MTGFGKATADLPSKKVTVEIKSLNSKQFDLSMRVSPFYREKEMQIRNELLVLERGKIEVTIYIEGIGKESSAKINLPVLESYYEQIKTISENLNIPVPSDWFVSLLRMPDVIKNDIAEQPDDSEWEVVSQTIQEAIRQLVDFQQQEGSNLKKLFEQKITTIASLLKKVDSYENERIDKLKSRITENLKKLPEAEYDSNRFEQEMIYYIEKLDINEEKTRLDNHLQYFTDTLNNGSGQGKKLGFIAQEIGREINTLGSKSNHVEIQKLVVQMKDELEQIKEQVLNIL
jgi:uncharacterized protein (TIGR00255 family)